MRPRVSISYGVPMVAEISERLPPIRRPVARPPCNVRRLCDGRSSFDFGGFATRPMGFVSKSACRKHSCV